MRLCFFVLNSCTCYNNRISSFFSFYEHFIVTMVFLNQFLRLTFCCCFLLLKRPLQISYYPGKLTKTKRRSIHSYLSVCHTPTVTPCQINNGLYVCSIDRAPCIQYSGTLTSDTLPFTQVTVRVPLPQ